jgi:outer membrane receptor for ferrienterochelin and colicin
LFLFLLSTNLLYAGITGTLSGVVRDKETKNVLPGANVAVEGTTMGAMADRAGYFTIPNLPAGTYDVTVTMIGYQVLTVRQVRINVDLETALDLDMTSQVLPMSEVIITNSRELIQSELTSSTYFVSGEDINRKLPIDSYRGALSLLPGIVGSHFRGGRANDVLYLLDGLPIQGSFSREVTSGFPQSSIVEMMVQTGGFSAEYGHSNSGVVNIVTEDGNASKAAGALKIYSDFIDTHFTENHGTRRVDLTYGGPATIDLGGPILRTRYQLAGDLNYSDTYYSEQLSKTYDSPIFRNYNLNGRLTFDLSPSTIFALQGLVSNWKWREFNSQWVENLAGIPEARHNSYRVSGALTHTFNPHFFATMRVAHYAYRRQVLGSINNDPPDLVFEDPQDPQSLILGGTLPWDENTKESVDIIRLDAVRQFGASNLMKTGIDYQHFNLNSRNLHYRALPGFLGRSQIGYSREEADFNYYPDFIAFYVQSRLQFGKITANLGARYDSFSPRFESDEIPVEFEALRENSAGALSGTRSPSYQTMSPRLGVSLPISKNEWVHVNYGWYYQMPPLYYIYLNADHRTDSYLPFVGNADLEPMKTVSAELSYKRVIAHDLLFVMTGFVKDFSNLVDTQTFLLEPQDIGESPAIGFVKYLNAASAKASGLELTLQKKFNEELSGRISYTYMTAKGTASDAEDEFEARVWDRPSANGQNVPLSWDQRHSLILNTGYETARLQLNLLYRLFSPLPVTSVNSPVPNDARLSWQHLFDLRLQFKSNKLMKGQLNPFIEIRNLFNEENILRADNNLGSRAYSLFDPMNSDFGRRLRVGMTLDF